MEDRPEEIDRRFVPTRWSLVQIAAMPADAVQRKALAELLSAYLAPLKSHLCRKWNFRPQDADDALQAFVTDQILQKQLLQVANRSRGKFRTFLLTSLDHFAANLIRDGRALKRGGGAVQSLPVDVDPGDGSNGLLDQFNNEWARTVLGQAVTRMKEACASDERDDLWGVFESRVLAPASSGDTATDYEDLVGKFGWKSPREASNRLMTAKRMFARCLREVVAEYLDDSKMVDQEILELRQILSTSGAGMKD